MFQSWREFKKDKSKKQDVLEFELNLEENIFRLHQDLVTGNYRHGGYHAFLIADPKLREIHKACVRDRLVHHAIVRIVTPQFEKSFVFDSYSARLGKGVHRAGVRCREFARRLSKNRSITVWVLKCDIRKFFDSVDHQVLLELLHKKIIDPEVVFLLKDIISSFHHDVSRGIPLGNLTSQLFSNVYLNPLDQFVKHNLRWPYYVRYADDFVFLGTNKSELEQLILKVKNFLADNLKLILHDDKIVLKKWCHGIDFLGFVHFSNHSIVRPRTRRRILQRVNTNNISSYLGIASHCNGYKLEQEIFRLMNSKI